MDTGENENYICWRFNPKGKGVVSKTTSNHLKYNGVQFQDLQSPPF